MRVTTNLMSNTITRHLMRQNQDLYKLQDQISSQKRISRPSDDPAGTRNVLGYRKSLASIDQYLDNVRSGISRIELVEINLDMAYELAGVAREITQTQINGTTSSRSLAAADARNLYDQLEGMANSKMDQNYMFSGHQTDTPAFGHYLKVSDGTPGDIVFGLAEDASNVTIEIRDQSDNILRTITPAGGGTDGINSVSWDGNDDLGGAVSDGLYRFTITASEAGRNVVDYGTYNGDSGDVRYSLGENTELTMDADGSNIFSPAGKENIFEIMADLITALENDDRDAIVAQKPKIDLARRQISEIRATNSPKLYQLESTENYWSNYKPKIEQMLAATEQVDLNQAIMEYKTLETAYQTTIATAARIIQPGLINFLR